MVHRSKDRALPGVTRNGFASATAMISKISRMSRTTFRPETDGYLFSNSWSYNTSEKKVAAKIVRDAAQGIEVAALPIVVAAPGPMQAP
jgi:hypothetical protein